MQNIEHTWKRTVDGPPIQPADGRIRLSGLARGTYRVTWWDTYRAVEPIVQTQTIEVNDTLDLALPMPLSTDIALKIERVPRVFLPISLR